MFAPFYNLSFIKYANLIGILDSRQAVSNGNSGARLHQTFQSLLYQTFRLRIQSRSSFVQNQNGGILQNGTGYADALSLTSGKLAATVADIRIIPFGLLHDKFMCIGYLGGFYHLFHCSILYTESYVVKKSIVEQNCFLIYITQQTSQIGDAHIFDIGSVYRDLSRLHIMIAGQKVDKR